MIRPITERDIGLKVLRQPPESASPSSSLDIIAVHGIGAHPDDAWSKEADLGEDGKRRWVNWLKDESMLPSAVPNARIMRYGYESQWFGDSVIHTKVTDVARRLLRALQRLRKDCRERPLLFVCHCFGGLVVVQALLDAYFHRDEWPSVYDATAGLIFFGTPFRGARGLSQGEMLEAALREYPSDQVQPETLHLMQRGNELLQNMVDEFCKTRSGPAKCEVACFWELKTSDVGAIVGGQKIMRCVVDEGSGCLDLSDATTKYSLSRTHFNMNKFVDPESDDYLTVQEVIQDMATRAPSMTSKRIFQRKNEKVVSQIDERERRDRICDWLSNHESEDQLSDIESVVTANTGNWFLQHDKYLQWKNGDVKSLLCPGIAGAGKTALSAVIVRDMLKSRVGADGKIGIAFYFCRYLQQSEYSLQRVLANLLAQLGHQSQRLPTALTKLYDELEASGARPSARELFNSLVTICTSFSKIFVVIDALDEWPYEASGASLTQNVTELQSQCEAVHLLLTSRPSAPLLTKFRESLHGIEEIEIRATDGDIERYLRESFNNVECLDDNDQETRNEMVYKVKIATSGMFILARLHSDSLKDSINKSELKQKMSQLKSGPDALKEAYQTTFDRIHSQRSGRLTLAELVLLCAYEAKRPLTSKEMSIAVTLQNSSREINEDTMVQMKQMVSVCAGLVTYQKDSDIVAFSHKTVSEHLQQTQYQWVVDNQGCLGKACLAYLQLIDLRNGRCEQRSDYKQRLKSNPFFAYSARFGGYHIHDNDRDITARRDFETLFNDEPRTKAIAEVIWKRKSGSRRKRKLHVLAHFGLSQGISETISNTIDIDINLKDKDGRTPLHIAAYECFPNAMNALLDNGADVNASSSIWGTPLQTAFEGGGAERVVEPIAELMSSNGLTVTAKGGAKHLLTEQRSAFEFTIDEMFKLLTDHETFLRPIVGDISYESSLAATSKTRSKVMVQILLEKGANVNVEAGSSGTALKAAVANDDEEATQMLLDHGADINAQGKNGTALQIAAQHENEAVLPILLERGADVNAQSPKHGTALNAAATMGSKKCVRMLLNHGANANVKCDGYDANNALHAAAKNGHDEVVRLLLGSGVDADITDKEGRTALHLAAECNHEENARVLLENKANVDRKDDNGRTALQWASRCGHMGIVRILLDAHADTEIRDVDNDGPLQLASWNRHEEIVHLLLDMGLGVNVADTNGDTSLHAASMRGLDVLVKLMLDHGANINVQDEDGDTPLHLASSNGFEEVVRLLLSRNAEVNVSNVKGRTSLFRASANGHQQVVKLLISNGADVDKPTIWGTTALYAASTQGHNEIVRLLLDSKACVNAKDEDGETALFTASKEGHQEVVQILLDWNGDANVRNNERRTPLQEAVFNRHNETAKLLLQRDVDVNTEDKKGKGAPLRIAAADGSHELVQLLLERNADINSRNASGQTAVQQAAKHGHKDVVQLLLQNNADPNLPTNKGNDAPLLVAARNGYLGITRTLLEHHADVNLQDNGGDTALHDASREGHQNVVNLLLEHLADVDTQNAKGFSSLCLAAVRGHKKIVKLLLDHHADVSLKTGNEENALELASRKSFKKIEKLLKAQGTVIEPKESVLSGKAGLPLQSRHLDSAVAKWDSFWNKKRVGR